MRTTRSVTLLVAGNRVKSC